MFSLNHGRKRWLVLALIVGAVLVVTAGCGGQAPAPVEEEAPAEAEAEEEQPAEEEEMAEEEMPEEAMAEAEPAEVSFGLTAKHAGYWTFYIADHKGFFEEENLTVDVVVTQDSASEAQALLSGALDITSGTPDGFLIANALERGTETEAVFALRNVPVYTLVGAKGMSDITDLEGQRVGVSTLTSSDAFFIQKMLAGAGLEEGDYEMIAVGGTPDRAAALESGGISGALIAQPQDFTLLNAGYSNLGVTTDYITDYAWAWGVVRTDWADENSDALVRFIRALAKATDWFYDEANRDEAVAILVEETGAAEEDAAATYDVWVQTHALVPDLRPSGPGMSQLVELMDASGQFEGAASLPVPEDFINTTYLDEALASLQ